LNTRGVHYWVLWLTRLADQLDDLICRHVEAWYALRLSNPPNPNAIGTNRPSADNMVQQQSAATAPYGTDRV
jgi:hypothetical protein